MKTDIMFFGMFINEAVLSLFTEQEIIKGAGLLNNQY